ncbi:40021_t:CDS:2, partial [Gigaspora margarita]
KSVKEADEVELNDDEGQLEEVDEDNNIREPSEDEIEIQKMHSTSYFHDGEKHNQVMVFPSDYYISELHDEAKGLKE